MQSALRSLFTPLHYWRTLTLVITVAVLIARIFQDITAVLLCTSACAFVFSSHENRRWIVLPTDRRVGDTIVRLLIAFLSGCTAYLTTVATSH